MAATLISGWWGTIKAVFRRPAVGDPCGHDPVWMVERNICAACMGRLPLNALPQDYAKPGPRASLLLQCGCGWAGFAEDCPICELPL